MSTAIGAAASAPATTSSVLRAARAAISRQTGVRVVESLAGGSFSLHLILDLGRKSAEETLWVAGARARFRLTRTWAWGRGNLFAREFLFGLTATQAQKVGNHWVSARAGTSGYVRVKSYFSIPSPVGYLPPANGTTLSTTVADGVHVYVLAWTTAATKSMPKASNTMTFSAAGATLPVELIETTSRGTVTTKYSRWGEHVAVRAPPVASTISYSEATS